MSRSQTGAVLRWGSGGNCPPNVREPSPQIFGYSMQYAVVKAANSYTGGAFFLEVGVVDLVVLACVFKGDD